MVLLEPDHHGQHRRVALRQQRREDMALFVLVVVRASLLALVDADAAWGGFTADEEQRFDAYDALYRRHLVDENGTAYPAARSLIRGEALRTMSADMMARRGVI